MAGAAPIGKKELLAWIGEITGSRVAKFEDLRDGVVILKAFLSIWPTSVDERRIRGKPMRFEWETKANWDLIKQAMTELQLPIQVYDKVGIQAGRFKACYSFLVMLFFLYNLSKSHDFSVDFAHPIDGKLAQFLQSPASVSCLERGGGLQADQAVLHGGPANSEGQAEEDSSPTPAESPIPSFAPSSASASAAEPSMYEGQYYGGDSIHSGTVMSTPATQVSDSPPGPLTGPFGGVLDSSLLQPPPPPLQQAPVQAHRTELMHGASQPQQPQQPQQQQQQQQQQAAAASPSATGRAMEQNWQVRGSLSLSLFAFN